MGLVIKANAPDQAGKKNTWVKLESHALSSSEPNWVLDWNGQLKSSV
jgi:hypothetical protein